MIDNHLHYTGSLPRGYLFQKFVWKRPDFLVNNNIKTLYDFDHYIDSKFSDDYKKNQIAFNGLYALFQSVTKPANDNILETYAEGAYEIAKKAISIGLDEYVIVAGPYMDIDKTRARFSGMVQGLKKAEKEFGKGLGRINITFIRDTNGKFKNYSDDVLEDICQLVSKPEFKDRIFGFDISGYEYPNAELLKENISVIKNIISKKKKYNLEIQIGLHAGETIIGTHEDKKYLEFFKQLSELDINRIVHGTYLWYKTTEEKLSILKTFADKCIFDICPTSNILLTPVGKKIKLSLDMLNKIGLKTTLNRDDPSILGNWETA